MDARENTDGGLEELKGRARRYANAQFPAGWEWATVVVQPKGGGPAETLV